MGCLAIPLLSLASPLLRACHAALARYASTDDRTGSEHSSLMHLRAGKSEDGVRAKRPSVEEHHMHTKTGICEKRPGHHGISTQLPHKIIHNTCQRGCQVWSIHAGLSCACFMAREATGAQEDAWSKPRRRHEQPLRPDLSLTIQNNMSLQLHDRFSPSDTAQRRRCRQCLL